MKTPVKVILWVLGLLAAFSELSGTGLNASGLSLIIVAYFAWRERGLLKAAWFGELFPREDLRPTRAGVVGMLLVIPLLLLAGSFVTLVLAGVCLILISIGYKALLKHLDAQAELARLNQPWSRAAFRASAPADMTNSEEIMREVIPDLARQAMVGDEGRLAGVGTSGFMVIAGRDEDDIAGDVLLEAYFDVDTRTTRVERAEQTVQGAYGRDTNISPVPDDEFYPAQLVRQADASEGIVPDPQHP